MGLSQQIVRVANSNLEKFYVINHDTIIAPDNPYLDHDYIRDKGTVYRDLEKSYNKALEDNDPEAEVYRKRMDELLAPYDEATVWSGRKENHIHQWVIDFHNTEEVKAHLWVIDAYRHRINDTNLDHILIDPDQLLGDLETVIKNPESAPEIMPTSSGFFFGSTDYDKFYFEDVMALHKTLNAEKKQGYFNNHSYFYWSWW